MAKRSPDATKTESPKASQVAGVPSLHARRGILFGIGGLLLLGGICHLAWQRVEPQVRSDSRYQVTAASIQISEQPEWLHSDVKLESLGRAGILDRAKQGAPAAGLSILDDPDQLEERIAMMLEFHPWVRSVGKIEKYPPNRLTVEVEYRTPIAALSTGLASSAAAQSRASDLIPIDQEGVLLLSSDLDPQQLGFLPRIDVKQLLQSTGNQTLRAGEQWTDPRIAGALDLVSRLGSLWYQLSLLDITPSSAPEVRGNQRYYVYDLRTNGGTSISWGASPSFSPVGESPFEAKLARLQSYIAQNGPLNSVQSSPKRINIRNGTEVIPRMVKLKKSADEKTRTAKVPEEKPVTKTALAPTQSKPTESEFK